MDVIIIMCLGVLVGKKVFPRKWKRINEFLQTICRNDFLSEIGSLGSRSFLFFLIPSVFSVLAVYPLTRIFLGKKRQKKKEEE